MNGKQVKLLRSQIRNVVQELFPQILTEELTTKAFSAVSQATNERLTKIEGHIKGVLESMENRSKEVQGFIMREAAAQLAKPQAATQEASAESSEQK